MLIAAVAAAASVACLRLIALPGFVPAAKMLPQVSPVARPGFNPAVAASAAVPVLLLAEDAHARYGDSVRKWSSVMVPLTTLILPAIVFSSFTIWSFTDDFAWQFSPNSKKGQAIARMWRKHPNFAGIKDPMNGLIYKDDFEEGLREAWEKSKPKASTITVDDKLKELSTQNNPHWYRNKIAPYINDEGSA